MSALRLMVLALTGLMALPLTGSAPQQSNYVDLNHSRLISVKIPAGTFRMGSDLVIHADDGWKPCSPRNEVERPVHQVTISKDFWMGQFDVTQKQWQQWQDVMDNNPSYNLAAGPDAPVEQVSWKDVQSFLAKANAMQSAWTVRLPTEAEWEYAARAGSTAQTYGPLREIAWYKANGGRTTHPVGQKKPNAFGL